MKSIGLCIELVNDRRSRLRLDLAGRQQHIGRQPVLLSCQRCREIGLVNACCAWMVIAAIPLAPFPVLMAPLLSPEHLRSAYCSCRLVIS